MAKQVLILILALLFVDKNRATVSHRTRIVGWYPIRVSIPDAVQDKQIDNIEDQYNIQSLPSENTLDIDINTHRSPLELLGPHKSYEIHPKNENSPHFSNINKDLHFEVNQPQIHFSKNVTAGINLPSIGIHKEKVGYKNQIVLPSKTDHDNNFHTTQIIWPKNIQNVHTVDEPSFEIHKSLDIKKPAVYPSPLQHNFNIHSIPLIPLQNTHDTHVIGESSLGIHTPIDSKHPIIIRSKPDIKLPLILQNNIHSPHSFGESSLGFQKSIFQPKFEHNLNSNGILSKNTPGTNSHISVPSVEVQKSLNLQHPIIIPQPTTVNLEKSIYGTHTDPSVEIHKSEDIQHPIIIPPKFPIQPLPFQIIWPKNIHPIRENYQHFNCNDNIIAKLLSFEKTKCDCLYKNLLRGLVNKLKTVN